MNTSEKFALAQQRYQGTIRTFAWKSYRQMQGYSVEDVEQELLVVLYECVMRYNPDRGAKFNTYFQQSCRNRVITLIRYYAAKRRTATFASLSEEAVAYAVDMMLTEPSAEDRVMNILDLQEYVAENGAEAIHRSRRGKRVVAA
jgi:RNA polymerase sigma factor (sigma-70 family)